jgi:hypothetical protein
MVYPEFLAARMIKGKGLFHNWQSRRGVLNSSIGGCEKMTCATRMGVGKRRVFFRGDETVQLQ